MSTFLLFCIVLILLFFLPRLVARGNGGATTEVGSMQPAKAGKWVVIALCVLYVISPIDVIPDVIPVLGWGDDVVAGLLGLTTALKK
jgi:hypothetical protein